MERRKFRTITVLADIVILAVSFIVAASTKTFRSDTLRSLPFPFFADLCLCGLSYHLLTGRCTGAKSSTLLRFSQGTTAVISLPFQLLALVMYLLREYSYSRIVVFGTAILATFLELLSGSIYIAYKKALVQDY